MSDFEILMLILTTAGLNTLLLDIPVRRVHITIRTTIRNIIRQDGEPCLPY